MVLEARDVMVREVITVSPETTLAELEDLLTSQRITGVPVVRDGKLVGIVSRSDIVRYFSLKRALGTILSKKNEDARLGELDHLRVEEFMAHDPITVAPNTPLEEIARTMVRKRVHRVVVTEGDRIVGLLSSLDVVRLVAEGKLAVAEARGRGNPEDVES
ncbi:MAG: hypothetical protein KatS3mg076_2741 [Candidatus Binatia bacterium]|nr:MAG: hypothetical protein KatS3mg076_2741 [Candidatus Binatia bacterium]